MTDSDWIPTAERQPTRSETYALITVAPKGRKKAFVMLAGYWIEGKRHMGKTGWASLDGDELDDVIAWMPIPDPYETTDKKRWKN